LRQRQSAELPKSPKTAKIAKIENLTPDEPLHGATDHEIAKNAKLPPSPRKNGASGGPDCPRLPKVSLRTGDESGCSALQFGFFGNFGIHGNRLNCV